MRSYYNLTRIETGFDASDVMTFHVAARWDEDRARVGQTSRRALLERLEELPHVSDAGMTNFLPVSGASLRYQISVDGIGGPNADGTDERRHPDDQRRLSQGDPRAAPVRRVVPGSAGRRQGAAHGDGQSPVRRAARRRRRMSSAAPLRIAGLPEHHVHHLRRHWRSGRG